MSSEYICNCGKVYKQEKTFKKHSKECFASDENIGRLFLVGSQLNDVLPELFLIRFSTTKKLMKEKGISQSQAKQELLAAEFIKYRNSLGKIVTSWEDNLLKSEHREFLKWVKKTYKNITFSLLANEKALYRFNLENTFKSIEKRIDESLVFLQNHKPYSNDFELINDIASGDISVYYVIFNDYMASDWFSQLDIDLQHEIEDNVNLASQIILKRINKNEFEELNKIANSFSPKVYEI